MDVIVWTPACGHAHQFEMLTECDVRVAYEFRGNVGLLACISGGCEHHRPLRVCRRRQRLRNGASVTDLYPERKEGYDGCKYFSFQYLVPYLGVDKNLHP